jgi:uncharacterized protein (TIGR02246 family)
VDREIAQSVQDLLDERAIRALLLEFVSAVDARDWDRYSRAFAPDGAFEILGQRRVGREAIAAGPARDLTRFARTQHFSTNHVVALDGDRATATAYVIAVHVPDAARPDEHADIGGCYHCKCVRTDEGWRFAEIRIEVLWTGGLEFTIPDAPTTESD